MFCFAVIAARRGGVPEIIVNHIPVTYQGQLDIGLHRRRNHGGSGGWCPRMFSDSYIARLNFIHSDHTALAYRSIYIAPLNHTIFLRLWVGIHFIIKIGKVYLILCCATIRSKTILPYSGKNISRDWLSALFLSLSLWPY